MKAATALAAGVLTLSTATTLAHQTVVSQYTFARDVAPILAARCGGCHVDGGTASPLTRYQDVKAKSWRIQQELLSRRMPPWYAEPGVSAFAGSESLTPNEFDVLMTWAAGGTPEGRSQPGRAASRAAEPAAPTPAAPVRTLLVDGTGMNILQPVRVTALRPIRGPEEATVSLTIVAPNGARRLLARLLLRERWSRRYAFVAPITIDTNSRIEVTLAPAQPDIWATLTGAPSPATGDEESLQLAIEVTD